MLAMIGGLGTTELIIILVVVVMLFGLGKLPQAAKQLGVGVRNFQKGVKGEDEADEEPKKLDRSKDEAKPAAEVEKEKVEGERAGQW